MSPRPLGHVPEPETRRLLAALAAATEAEAELHAAVRAAFAAGGSVREIARVLAKSTNTIQAWTRGVDRTGTPDSLSRKVEDTSSNSRRSRGTRS